MNPPADRPASHNQDGHTVLLIDDDPTNLSVISDCLVNAGLEVLIARDGENGLQKARYARPHIILLDVVMPGIDGLETCRRLKADAVTKDIPVLFITALTSTRDRIRAYAAGGVDYVTKPIQVEELLARVQAHLTLHDMTQQLQAQGVQVQQAIAEREQADAARQITEAHLHTLIDQLPFDLWAMDAQLRYTMQNATSRKRYGEVVGKRIEDLHLPAEIEAQWLEQDRRVLAGETLRQEYDTEVAAEKRHYENLVVPVKVNDTIVGIVGTTMDVTDRKQVEEELQRYREQLEELVAERTAELTQANRQLQVEIEERKRVEHRLSQVNRTLKLLSECNQVLVRAEDEAGLLQEICRIIVELGSYPLAWVGFIEHAAARRVRPAAHWGDGADYVASLEITWADTERGQGPTGVAIRSGQPGFSKDIQSDPHFAPWREAALQQGYASVIALPLQVGGQVLGALNIYATQPDCFSPDEVNLLMELAGDLAYGLTALRTRSERERAEAALADEHHLLRTLIDSMPDYIYIKDTESRFLVANQMVAWNMGTTPEELIGKRDADYYPPELAEKYYADEQAVIQSGAALINREEPNLDSTGNRHWVSTTKVPLRDNQGRIRGIVGIGRDITSRKEMEEALRWARDDLEARVAQRTAEWQRASEQLVAIYKVGQIVSARLELETVLNEVARNTAKLLNSDTGVILLLDDAGEILTIHGAYGLSEAVVQGTRDRVGESIAGRVAQTRQPIIANDLPNHPYFHNPATANEGLLACASVPLIAGDKLIGTLDIHSKTQREAFNAEHIQVLQLLASQAVIAIENARLYQQLQQAHAELEARVQQRTADLLSANTRLQQEIIERQRVEHEVKLLNQDLERRSRGLAALNRASQIMASTLDLDVLLKEVIEQVRSLLAAEAISVLLNQPAPTEISAAQQGAAELVFAAVAGPRSEQLLGMRLPVTTGVVGWVVRETQPALIQDAQSDPRFYQGIDAETGLTTRSLVAVPLLSKGVLLGVIEAINKSGGVFDQQDLEVLQALSNSAAIAIENARLYASEQQRATALSDALEQQRKLDQMQREFIQNVSHELRTPLALILGHAETLEAGWLGELLPEQKGSLGVISRRARMLAQLVNDIVGILETERLALAHESFDLAALVKACLLEFQHTIEKAGLTLVSEIAPEVPVISGDPLTLRRVLDNLIGNALKFTQPGGQITVRLQRQTSSIRLEVSDTGIGIAPEHLAHIFERFYQIDGSATRKHGGMGLGLALVKEFIEAHGGQVDVVSQLNVGTTFTVSLPVANT
ncbi:two-component system, NarL family, sensor histidine kinase EvgS [Thermoflexales bacterium]|nr:two-component system, NarL family, sensor histidine kinase EvgS [Thermoflexales bacterium]